MSGTWQVQISSNTCLILTVLEDPATGLKIGDCPDFDQADAIKAIEAAHAALTTYRELSGRQRSKLLRKWYDLIIENKDDLATLITWENGKPIAEGAGEVQFAAELVEWFSEEAPRIYGDSIPSSCGRKHIVTYKEPIGVCALITP